MKFKKRIAIEKENKLETKKKMKPETKRRLFFMFLILVFASIPVTVIQANTTLSKAKKINADTENLVKTIEDGGQRNDRLFSPLVEVWLDQFVNTYLTLNRDQDQFKERELSLESYMAVRPSKEENLGINQKVTYGKLLDIRKEGDHEVALYKVKYHSEAPVKKEHEVKRGNKKVMEDYMDYEEYDTDIIVNIPYVEKDYRYKVVGLPYYSSEEELTLKNYKIKTEELNLDSIKNDEKNSVKKFVELFLTKYVSGTKEDMTFLMATPNVLGTKGYTSKLKTIEISKKDDKYVAYITYALTNDKTKLSHEETMSLLITKRENNYFVEKQTHYIGGITNEKK